VSGPGSVPDTADAVRTLNARLDDELLSLADSVPAADLLRTPGGQEWSAGQLLAHAAEFPHFFAADLRRWREDPPAVVGRTHDHEARLTAVDDPFQGLELAVAAVREALADLAGALRPLVDADLTAGTVNVKYGDEPLTAFLDRYVLGHKAGHVEQLRRTLAALAG